MTDRFDHFYVYDTVSYTEFTTFKQYIYSEGQLNAVLRPFPDSSWWSHVTQDSPFTLSVFSHVHLKSDGFGW